MYTKALEKAYVKLANVNLLNTGIYLYIVGIEGRVVQPNAIITICISKICVGEVAMVKIYGKINIDIVYITHLNFKILSG